MAPSDVYARSLSSARAVMLAASAFHTHRHEAALKLGYLTAVQFDQWVRLAYMTHPLTK